MHVFIGGLVIIAAVWWSRAKAENDKPLPFGTIGIADDGDTDKGETKAKGKKLTPRQEQTKADIEAAGGLVLVVDDFASMALAMAIIEDWVHPGYHQ